MNKLQISMRYWLLGRGYNLALKAMEFGAEHHTGFRKDGVTPEFNHQISIAHYLRTLPGLLFPEETLATAFLHDVSEDYHVDRETLAAKFGPRVADAVWRMTKEFRGVRRAEAEVFTAIAQCPIASIAKAADRIHNFQSMVGVFKLEKQKVYIEEGEEHFLPMIKKARRLFPEQEPAYENAKHMLRSQMDLIRAIHAAHDT